VDTQYNEFTSIQQPENAFMMLASGGCSMYGTKQTATSSRPKTSIIRKYFSFLALYVARVTRVICDIKCHMYVGDETDWED
jgi:hypothetical protein